VSHTTEFPPSSTRLDNPSILYSSKEPSSSPFGLTDRSYYLVPIYDHELIALMSSTTPYCSLHQHPVISLTMSIPSPSCTTSGFPTHCALETLLGRGGSRAQLPSWVQQLETSGARDVSPDTEDTHGAGASAYIAALEISPSCHARSSEERHTTCT
jgi:hypothetical protein